GRALREAENWDEIKLVENNFFNEFKNAQSNLYANIAAGRGPSMAYFGPGTGTSPLPIFLAYFTGNGAALASDQTRYTGTSWTNAAIASSLAQLNPAPANAASALAGNATFRANAIAAGLPRNFFQLNPDASAVNVHV